MPTKAYVDKAITDGITTSASMVLKGSFNTTSGEWYTTTTFSQGDTYVSTQTINHSVFGAIEPGDLIIANKNGASKTVKDDWIIVQKNVDLVGAKDTIGLIKNGSPVTDASGYTASPIIGGIPYYKYTDDTKVTAVGNHYAPAADDNRCSSEPSSPWKNHHNRYTASQSEFPCHNHRARTGQSHLPVRRTRSPSRKYRHP